VSIIEKRQATTITYFIVYHKKSIHFSAEDFCNRQILPGLSLGERQRNRLGSGDGGEAAGGRQGWRRSRRGEKPPPEGGGAQRRREV